MDPVAKQLAELLKAPVKKIDVAVGPEAKKAVAALNEGEVLLLENIRFTQGGKKRMTQSWPRI